MHPESWGEFAGFAGMQHLSFGAATELDEWRCVVEIPRNDDGEAGVGVGWADPFQESPGEFDDFASCPVGVAVGAAPGQAGARIVGRIGDPVVDEALATQPARAFPISGPDM